MKVLLGIGDSWTAGVGAVPDSLRPKDYPNNRNYFYRYGSDIAEIPDIIQQELNGSWVKQLTDDLSLTPINLGVSGSGNRAAVKSLYYNNIPWNEITGGYMIFMLSSISRLDLFSYDFSVSNNRPFYTVQPPDETDDNQIKTNYEWWVKNIQTDNLLINETVLSILEAQAFCKQTNLNFYFGFSFDKCEEIYRHCLSDNIDWTHCLTKDTCFLDILASKQQTPRDLEWYFNQKQSTELISKCCHPTAKGYKFIADYIQNYITHDHTN